MIENAEMLNAQLGSWSEVHRTVVCTQLKRRQPSVSSSTCYDNCANPSFGWRRLKQSVEISELFGTLCRNGHAENAVVKMQ